MKIGILKLADAAPAIVAQELGFFAEEAVPAVLFVEPSWGNIADKLVHGLLDAAVIVPPLAFALALGLRGPATRLIVPQAVSLGGNSITLSSSLMKRLPPIPEKGPQNVLEYARGFASLLKQDEPIRLAVVHQFSTHALQLRYWLAAGGTDPERDVVFVTIPPSQMVEALASGAVDGFCAGAPWGDIASAQRCGQTITSTHGIWLNGPEKVLAVSERWAASNRELLRKAQRALLRAAQYCDLAENNEATAAILAQPEYLNIDAGAIAAALPGQEESEIWRRPALCFLRHEATMPWLNHAEWFLNQMRRWGQLPAPVDIASSAAEIYRPDLYRAAALSLGLAVPQTDKKEPIRLFA